MPYPRMNKVKDKIPEAGDTTHIPRITSGWPPKKNGSFAGKRDSEIENPNFFGGCIGIIP